MEPELALPTVRPPMLCTPTVEPMLPRLRRK